MNKMLIATDYDGTLNRGGIDEKTRSAIDAWRAAGRYFGVVTGRGVDFYDTAREERLPFDFLIVCTGSLILSPEKEILYESRIPADVFASLERAMRGYRDVSGFSESDGKPRYSPQ